SPARGPRGGPSTAQMSRPLRADVEPSAWAALPPLSVLVRECEPQPFACGIVLPEPPPPPLWDDYSTHALPPSRPTDPLFGTGVRGHPPFALLLREAARLRNSDLPPAEKGRQIAKLVRPWMTWPQVHGLFGESEAVLYDLPSHVGCCRALYLLYGVCVQFGRTGTLEAKSLCVQAPTDSPYFESLKGIQEGDKREVERQRLAPGVFFYWD